MSSLCPSPDSSRIESRVEQFLNQNDDRRQNCLQRSALSQLFENFCLPDKESFVARDILATNDDQLLPRPVRVDRQPLNMDGQVRPTIANQLLSGLSVASSDRIAFQKLNNSQPTHAIAFQTKQFEGGGICVDNRPVTARYQEEGIARRFEKGMRQIGRGGFHQCPLRNESEISSRK